MKLLAFLLCCLCTSSCQSAQAPSTSASRPDTTPQLSNNIMVIYQDKDDVYWFGSWEDGLYRYDRKTITHYTSKDGLRHNRINLEVWL